MENSSFLQDYVCSTSQEIPRLLENLQGDDNSNRLHIKMWTQYSLYQYTKKLVSVLCWRLRFSEETSTHYCH